MKKVFLIVVFLIGLVYSQTQLKPQLVNYSTGILPTEIKARLIDYSVDILPPSCGKIAAAGKFKFELMEKFGTVEKGEKIFILIACPRELKDLYENDAIYKIVIYGDDEEDKSHKNYSWSILNTYGDENLPEFWCKKLIQDSK